jgi:hypothetical protein
MIIWIRFDNSPRAGSSRRRMRLSPRCSTIRPSRTGPGSWFAGLGGLLTLAKFSEHVQHKRHTENHPELVASSLFRARDSCPRSASLGRDLGGLTGPGLVSACPPALSRTRAGSRLSLSLSVSVSVANVDFDLGIVRSTKERIGDLNCPAVGLF